MAVAELTLLKTSIYLGVRAPDADHASRLAVQVYKAFISRLFDLNTGAGSIRIDVEDPVQRKDLPEVWDCPATMRAEVPDTVRFETGVATAHSHVDTWRNLVRAVWKDVTRDYEQDVYRTGSYVALTRPVIPGEDQVQEAKPAEPKKLIAITVKFQGQTHNIEVPDSDTLLDGVLDKGIPLKFQCKAGVCDECRVKVVNGMENLPPINENEVSMLGDRVKQGYRLSCQVSIKGPVTIEQ